MPATSGRPRGCDVVVGIDAGGSATRARAVRAGALVHEGAGGPGNPLMAGPEVVEASYRAALAGCPAAGRVAACVSGAGGDAQRAQVAEVLAGRFPAAEVRVAPDYVAAFPGRAAGERRVHRGGHRLGGVQPGGRRELRGQRRARVDPGRSWRRGAAGPGGAGALRESRPGGVPARVRGRGRLADRGPATGGRWSARCTRRPKPGAAAGPGRAAAHRGRGRRAGVGRHRNWTGR